MPIVRFIDSTAARNRLANYHHQQLKVKLQRSNTIMCWLILIGFCVVMLLGTWMSLR